MIHEASESSSLRRTVCGGTYGPSMSGFRIEYHKADDTAGSIGASSDDASDPALQRTPPIGSAVMIR